MPTVLKSEEEFLNSLKLPQDSQGNLRFTTDLQGHIRTSDGDLRTETFQQMWVTMGERGIMSDGNTMSLSWLVRSYLILSTLGD